MVQSTNIEHYIHTLKNIYFCLSCIYLRCGCEVHETPATQINYLVKVLKCCFRKRSYTLPLDLANYVTYTSQNTLT